MSAASKKRKADDTEEHEEVKKLKEECLDQLSELRNEIANQNNLANPETIIGINVLRGLADALPSNEQEMFKCIGITENWYQIWGEEFLEVMKIDFINNIFVLYCLSSLLEILVSQGNVVF